jgi:thiamine pyrophosphokinase
MTILVFANGDLESGPWLQPYLAEASLIIAANGGTRHLYRLQQPPHIVIGDLDSLPDEIRTWVKTADVQIIQHPADKDETDLELALLLAIQHHQDIYVMGALGGRLDQTLANILLLAHPALQGHKVQLVAPYQQAWLVDGDTEANGRPGDTVSLIPLGGDTVIRSTTVLIWPLQNETLAFGSARGVSNVMTADQATIEVESGRLLCIHTQQAWQR